MFLLKKYSVFFIQTLSVICKKKKKISKNIHSICLICVVSLGGATGGDVI